MRINNQGYVERRTVGRSGKKDVPENFRSWWLVKGHIGLNVHFPQKYLGKRVRFKIEVLE